jgi:aryl-alcohol dehydrogenase-like predicted oxidoreductase
MEKMTYREMPYRRLGASGLWLSEIGLGLWKWGDPDYDGSRVGEHEGFHILDRALELGVTHWDTANSYNGGSGNCERLLGKYFSQRGSRVRDQIVLATKVRNPVRAEHELSWDFTPNERGASRKYIREAVEGCLQRLQTDRIDILYHHAPCLTEAGGWETPLEETWDALNNLVAEGKVHYLAVSNRTGHQLESEIDALSRVAQNPARRIVGIQNPHNLLQRGRVTMESPQTAEKERAFLNQLKEQGVGLIPYIPLAVGLLTGRYRQGQIDEAGRLANEAWGKEFLTEDNLDKVESLIQVADEKECSLAQLALAWLLAQETTASVIAGVTKMRHLEDNVKAVSIALSPKDLERLAAIVA